MTANGDGTGVWGASSGGVGVHGQSDNNRGGRFESRRAAQVNLKPSFLPTLPCAAEAGDLIVITEVPEGQDDDSPQGGASLWFCIKAGTEQRPAIWARVSFDGIATCAPSLPATPQDRPRLG
jgi:hypothetical protein